jgi:site-specific DNA-methyltransferase (adenine-specific)
LSWAGKDAALTRQRAQAARIERVFASHWGVLYAGDNLATMRALAKDLRGKVMLAYLDPPFLTGRVHEILGSKRAAFDDRWTDRACYLEQIAPRIAVVRELLAPEGSMVLHVDPKTSHYLKVLCDEIFGEDAFASEIVWRYRRWPAKTPNFQRVHDVLLRYRKDPKVPPRWNTLYEPLAPSTLATWGTGKQRAVYSGGKRLRSSTMKEKTPGVPMGDVWDIGVIAPVSKERTGYPSQKPEALLERLICALTNPGDLVLDPYAGSGTTLVVAARLGRHFVGIDASEAALEIAVQRLACARQGMTRSVGCRA